MPEFTEVKWLGRGSDHPPLTSTGLQIGWNYTFATALYCIGMSWDDLCLLTLYILYMALQPNAGYGLLIHEVSEITHTTRHSR
jgi:hypothetical protein